MATGTVKPWLQSVADELMKVVTSETARTRFREHVNEWCADPQRDVHMLPPRPTRRLTAREQYVALAAIHDTVCVGNDPLGPDVCNPADESSDGDGRIFNKPLMAYAALIHAHVPRLKEAHAIGVRGWLQTVKQDLSRRKRKLNRGDRKAGLEKRLYAELCTCIRSEQARIKTDERLSPNKPLQKQLARRVRATPPDVCKCFREHPDLRTLWNAFDSRQLLLNFQLQ